MERVQQQDEAAFEELLNRYLNKIHAYAYRMCQNREDAEDIAQATFMRVWSRAHTWRPDVVQFTTWVHQIARNLCIDQFRKQNRNTSTDIDMDSFPTESISRDEELIVTLQQVISQLPERQRTALMLCQVEGWTHAEAAVVLAVSVEAVESLLARARRTLRKRLENVKE